MKSKLPRLLLFPILLLSILGCTRTEWTDIKTIKPGYLAFSDSTQVSLTVTKEEGSASVVYDPVEISLRFFFKSQISEFQKVGIKKILQDEDYQPVAICDQGSFKDISDTLAIDILTRDTLFAGLTFNPDSIRSGFTFLFKTYLVTNSGDTIFSVAGDYTVIPQYVNFCTIPEIPAGIWEIHNKATGFKKDIEIRYMELGPAWFTYVFTDFGIDWSRWNDFWYGTDFYLGCPLAGDDRYVVKLAAWGIDLAGIRLEMKNDKGELETRPLRIMPWTYADDSPDIGYYDATARQFIFKNVKLRDTWWDIDNALIQEVTITYKEE
ncbi:MAG TPA: hypothetical protein DC042_15455 [Bacteroidales bacterium]|nr:hypothetical protein [Bacteroidales bacterium]